MSAASSSFRAYGGHTWCRTAATIESILLVAIARKRLELEKSLYQILQIFSITSLEKVPILQVFEAFDSNLELLDNSNQLILFGL